MYLGKAGNCCMNTHFTEYITLLLFSGKMKTRVVE